MKKIAILLTLFCVSLPAFTQNAPPAEQPKSDTPKTEPAKPEAPKWVTERPSCKAYRIGDPKGEWCGRTCDTGLEARCTSVAMDSPNPPACGCLKAQGLEGVNAFSICSATKKDAKGQEWASCAIACDKRTVATCVDGPEYPEAGAPSCKCEVKASKKS